MENKDNFDKIYKYVVLTSMVVLFYVIAITFVPIPEKNQRFVDIALAFLLGFISSNSSYLTGGNPSGAKKSDTPAGTTTASIVADITTSPSEPTETKQDTE